MKRKVYFLAIAAAMFSIVSAQTTKVAVISQQNPAADTVYLVRDFMNYIDAMDGYEAVWVSIADIITNDWVASSGADVAVVTENGGSSSMANYLWPVPTVNLKSYAMGKGANPLFTSSATTFYSWPKTSDWDPNLGILTVVDNSDILSCYGVGDEVIWTTGYNDTTTESAGSGEAHVQGMDLKASDIAGVADASTALATSKALVEDAANANAIVNFLWKLEGNSATHDNMGVAWGVHWGLMEKATSDFYDILGKAIMWVNGEDVTCATGIEDNNVAAQINVYPNPVVDNLSINSAELINKISLFDVTGKTITVVENILNNNYTLNMNTLNSGIYFVQVETVNGIEVVQKIVK